MTSSPGKRRCCLATQSAELRLALLMAALTYVEVASDTGEKDDTVGVVKGTRRQ